ncbi:hypothetical protein HMPREF9225_0894 [Peptoniphilus duerdenii ATCC BAA-1640]|uniref:Uncharacterized protein n=1 Tax=Peptoniphilus duerdenii ATCC BAA-1640 TaxID=862517 RepID=E0NL55_9FIRM|nr:hypothetical protein HMPREF9225_0894 [Peptoniphilus duerdenii ATCC BAA-1640]
MAYGSRLLPLQGYIFFYIEHVHKIKSSKRDSVWKKLVKFKPKETGCKSHCLSEASCEFAGRRGLEFLSFCNRNRLGAFIFVIAHLHILDLRRLYPFDSLRSLRVTAVAIVYYFIK